MKRRMKTAERIELLDVVELRVESGRWPVGTAGTVVEKLERGAIVEIADEHGHTLDMLSLPYVALTTHEPFDQQRLAV
jgi:hypothetical protein